MFRLKKHLGNKFAVLPTAVIYFGLWAKKPIVYLGFLSFLCNFATETSTSINRMQGIMKSRRWKGNIVLASQNSSLFMSSALRQSA
jgi:hypothetical protein